MVVQTNSNERTEKGTNDGDWRGSDVVTDKVWAGKAGSPLPWPDPGRPLIILSIGTHRISPRHQALTKG